MTGGNGAPHEETEVEYREHVERLLESIQAMLDTQFKRISDMQVEIDRLTRRFSNYLVPSRGGTG